jgi:cell division transport system permease protein
VREMKELIPDDEGADRYLPWVVAIILFMAELALAAALALNGAASTWRGDLAGTVTIEIPGETPDADIRAADIADAVALLPGVKSARPIGQAEVARLLSPWFGEAGLSADLPLPRLIDVRLAQGEGNMEQLEAAAQAVLAEARVDDHQLWLGRLLRLARGFKWLSLSVVLLTGGALCLIMVFGTRAALAAHGPVIELLHLMGARDSAIASRFQRHAIWLAFRGSMVGLAVAAAVLYMLGRLAAGLEGPLIGDLHLSPLQLGLLALLPLPTMALGGLTARITVLRSLARMN